MLSRDQKSMLGLGMLVLLGLASYWLLSRVSVSALDIMGDGMRVAVQAFIVLFVLFLIVLGILMPLFIYYIWSDVRRMREVAEKNEHRIAQMRADFSALKQMWTRE